MTYFYLKPYEEPENRVLHIFACTEVFEEMQQTFHSLILLAKTQPAFEAALEKMTISYD